MVEDNVRVPTADETSAAIERANRALGEIRSREEMDAREEEQHRADQLAEWQARDEAENHLDEAATDERAREPSAGQRLGVRFLHRIRPALSETATVTTSLPTGPAENLRTS